MVEFSDASARDSCLCRTVTRFVVRAILVQQGSQTQHGGFPEQGSRVWVLARLNRAPLVIADGDEVDKFILLSHGHDG